MKTKIIGLTGGIGSGKSTIARYFAAQGIPVYIADDEAKKILFEPDTIIAVKDVFGERVLTNGQPDRKKLADAVFGNPEKLRLLNGIIHPRVQRHFTQWVSRQGNAPFVIKEAAILFESGSYKDCDAIILVTAPQEIRLQRVMERDNISREKVLERMANQWDDAKKMEISDFIIENTDLELAKAQADTIVKNLNNRQ